MADYIPAVGTPVPVTPTGNQDTGSKVMTNPGAGAQQKTKGQLFP